MAKKRATKKSPKAMEKGAKSARSEQIVLDPDLEKVLRLLDKSAKMRADLDKAVPLAAAKAVRKVAKDHGIILTPPQASELTSILFGE